MYLYVYRLQHSWPENRQKNVDIVIARRDGGTVVVITDPGAGFNWRSWLALDPARAGDNHGRGIALARNLSFDSLTYNDSGNKLTAYAKKSIDIKW